MSFPKSLVILLVPVLLLADGTAGLFAQDKPAAIDRSAEKAQLAAVLASEQPYADKLAACKQLALIGDKDSVPALAALLTDEKLSHAARIGLEAIPDRAADEALRDALTRVRGAMLVGVIHSVGARRDREAVSELKPFLTDSGLQVAAAAADALGKLATTDAATCLRETLATAPSELRPAVGRAALACADRLRRQENCSEAKATLEALRKTELPLGLIAAATRGLMLCRPEEAAGLLAGEIAAPEGIRFAMALGAVGELPTHSVTKVLVDRLPALSEDRQALVITALGDRGDKAAREAVVKATDSTTPAVRIAAIRALATLGDVSTIALLLDAAAESDPEVTAAALASLASLSGAGVDAAIISMLEEPQGDHYRIVVALAGRRQIASAIPALLKAADSTEPPTRLAAIASLGETIGAVRIPVLTRRLLAPTGAEETAAVQTALRNVCRRSVERDACAKRLVECLPGASRETRAFLLELLGSIGGPTALKAVSAAALDEDEQIRDTATRVLGEWHSPEVAPALLDVTGNLPAGKYRVRALRGALRALRQMDIAQERRLAMCHEAMQLADRNEERALAVEVFGRIPSPVSLAVVVPLLQTAELKAAAASATVSIGEKIAAEHPKAVAKAMAEVLGATSDANLVRRAKEILAQAEKR